MKIVSFITGSEPIESSLPPGKIPCTSLPDSALITYGPS